MVKMWGWVWLAAAAVVLNCADGAIGAARLVCYVEKTTDSFSECTHLVYTGEARGDKLDAVLKDLKRSNSRSKILLRVSETDEDLKSLLKAKHIQGLELHNGHRTLNRTKILAQSESARAAISAAGGGPLFLSLPANPELLAKYYDLRALLKVVDLMIAETHELGIVKKMTFHPSRLSGMWDMMNTDSVVDLVVGLGVPASKVLVSLPATAWKFSLLNESLSTPGSPTTEDNPKEVDQAELCRLLQKGRWTLERDQDLSAPYAFKNTTWISFEDSSSIDVKGKYARVRGLAGLALHEADRDVETPCGPTLRSALTKVLNQQSRAPRAAVLRSLEHEILAAPSHARALDALQVSPYRITQVVDSDGVIHSIREDTRTEFSCSRQGYFVHPRSCARFYRCVKFDQLSPDYTVFEFDCPAGLAFDSRYEVCVWPGSLPHSQACPGSSEIAPVPKTRFICPEHEGYYADPENCRWFFACLDHGKAPLTAYEFRCPFGLGFDAARMKCDWPWLVPACGNIARYEAEAFGFSGAALTGATGYHGQTADSVNVAAHQSLISGASFDNLVGIQGGFLSNGDSLDANFIASQEFDGGHQNGDYLAHQSGQIATIGGNLGLVQATKYDDDSSKYTSGSLILDDYRLPTDHKTFGFAHGGFTGANADSASFVSKNSNANYQYNADAVRSSDADNSGAYVHDPTGDHAEPYRHLDSPAAPYVHDGSAYKDANNYNDFGQYKGSYQGKYVENNSGEYSQDNSGAYYGEANRAYQSDVTGSSGGSYKADYSGYYSGSYDSGKHEAGIYRTDVKSGLYDENAKFAASGINKEATSGINIQQYHGSYAGGNSADYLTGANAYTGSSHTLAAGAVNVGLVGKTTLVDANYIDQGNYYATEQNAHSSAPVAQSFGTGHQIIHQTAQNGQLSYVAEPAVSISHVGTDSHNLDGYGYVTTPTASVVPTTVSPITITTALPTVTYKTSFIPEPPMTSIKQIFGYAQPAVTYVQPTVVPVKQYDQGFSFQFENKHLTSNLNAASVVQSESSGYNYPKPSIKFEEGVTYTTAAPAIQVSTFKPRGFSHATVHKTESDGSNYQTPVVEEPFKKIIAYTTGTPDVAYVQPAVANFAPQSFSHQTIHRVESGYEYAKPAVPFEEPQTLVEYTTAKPVIPLQPGVTTTYRPQILSQQTVHNVDVNHVNTYAEDSVGYEYKKPAVNFVQVTNPQPAVFVSTPQPHSFSQQTVHKVDDNQYNKYQQASGFAGYQYDKPAVDIVHAPSPQPANTFSTYKPQSFSHQTIHKVEANQYNDNQYNVGYEDKKPAVVSTIQPAIVTYKPQSFSQQTIHKVEANHFNDASAFDNFEYKQPAIISTAQPAVVSFKPHSFSQQTIHKVEANQYNDNQYNVGYEYNKPAVVSTIQPAIAEYTPQSFSHQTIHKVEANQYNDNQYEVGYEYNKPAVVSTIQPAIATYKPQSFSQQTIHKVEANHFNDASAFDNFEYKQPAIISTAQPAVVSFKPHSFSQQTIHKVEENQFDVTNGYSKAEGYEYLKPDVKFEEVKPIKLVQPQYVVDSQQPQSYGHQTIHKVETQHYIPSSTALPQVEIKPAVTVYQNPILKYTQKSTPVSYAKPNPTVYTQPIAHQHQVNHIISQPIQYESAKLDYQSGYSYSQPEIQRNIETFDSGRTYSQASDVSHQVFHISNGKSEVENKNVVFVSTTPAALAYEEHFAEYQAPKKVETYKAPDYIPPKTTYQEYYVASTTAAPVVQQQQYVAHQAQEQYNYKQEDYSQQYEISRKLVPVQQVSFSTSHVQQPKKVESFHLSSFPGTTVRTIYQSPEIQDGYKSEEYLPPVVSTSVPVVTSTYAPRTSSFSPRTYSTTTSRREYLPPTPEPEYNAPEYLPPVENNYLPPSTTAKPVIISTFAPRKYSTVSTTPREYLPPTPEYNAPEYLPPVENTYLPPSSTPRIRSRVKSTTPKYVESTTHYKAPEYLPPQDENDAGIVNFESFGLKSFDSSSESKLEYNPYQEHNIEQEVVYSSTVAPKRQQNIVVETAKSHLLGFGTVGPDAGLVSTVTYASSTPIVISSTERYTPRPKAVKTTYAPIEQELTEVTPSPYPARRVKPKVAVVTKINDFNPLLVRKLGAVCSCQSPIVVLRGRRPNFQGQADYDIEYNDYEDSGRGDVNDYQWAQKSARIQQAPVRVKAIKTTVTSTTFNPIIVPDDAYYQDYQDSSDDNVEVTPKSKQVYSENYVSSTPAAYSSTTEKVIRIRPRVKSTAAPTYKTVLLNDVTPTPTAITQEFESSTASKTFDRYGAGGLRGRDETLQGSVDCQRAGLFRHPKQCNKFYACRWDCTKQRFTLHIFNCPVQLSFDPTLGACNWPSQGPACQGDTLLTNTL